MLPIKDNVPTRTRPVVTMALIAVNFAVWILYELPHLERSVNDYAYHPCEVEHSCQVVGHDWLVTAFTSMFMHGSWMHLLGNMLFLWIFGNNVEDRLGRAKFLLFYVAGGLVATALQTFVTLHYGTEAAGRIPNLGASGAIAAVLGGYILLHPTGRVLTWIAPIFFIPIPAFLYLGIWFVFQALSGSAAFTHPEADGGVAYFAHIGGFIFGLLTVRLFGPNRYERPRRGLLPSWR